MILCSYDAASVIDRLFFKSACRFYPSGFSSSPLLPLPPLLPPPVAISSPLVWSTRYSSALYHIFQPFSRSEDQFLPVDAVGGYIFASLWLLQFSPGRIVPKSPNFTVAPRLT